MIWRYNLPKCPVSPEDRGEFVEPAAQATKPVPAWKSLPVPEVNSRWDRRGTGSTRTARVMGVVEGYVVARLSGCSPFLTHMSDWHLNYTPKIMPKRQRRGIELSRPEGK